MKETLSAYVIDFIFFLKHSFLNIPLDRHWRTVKTKNTAAERCKCGMASCNRKLYLMGGDGSKQVEVFDTKTAVWTTNRKPLIT